MAALAAGWLTPALPYLDDAYIVAHSAEVLRSGHDAAFGVPALVGITSPGYLALVWLVQALGASPLLSLQIVTAAGCWLLALGAWRLVGDLGADGWRRWAVPVLVLASGQTVLTLTNGLETGWAAALMVWAVVAVRHDRPWLAVALSGLLPALRPDMVPLVAIVAVAAGWSRPWTTRVALALTAAAIALPFFAWVRLDTGAWSPQTLDAKRVFFAEGCWPITDRVDMAGRVLQAWALATPVVVVGALASVRVRLARWGLAGVLVILAAYTSTLPGGIAHNDSRYLTPLLLPFALTGLATVLRAADVHAGRSGAAAATGLLAALAAWSPATFVAQSAFARDVVDTAAWIGRETPADARLLVHDAGGLSVLTRHPLVDMVGLKSPASIGEHARTTWPSCGRQRSQAIDAIARAGQPQYLVVVDEWERIFRIADGLKAAGWTLTAVRTHPPGTNGYDVYRLAR